MKGIGVPTSHCQMCDDSIVPRKRMKFTNDISDLEKAKHPNEIESLQNEAQITVTSERKIQSLTKLSTEEIISDLNKKYALIQTELDISMRSNKNKRENESELIFSELPALDFIIPPSSINLVLATSSEIDLVQNKKQEDIENEAMLHAIIGTLSKTSNVMRKVHLIQAKIIQDNNIATKAGLQENVG